MGAVGLSVFSNPGSSHAYQAWMKVESKAHMSSFCISVPLVKVENILEFCRRAPYSLLCGPWLGQSCDIIIPSSQTHSFCEQIDNNEQSGCSSVTSPKAICKKFKVTS